MEDVQRQMPFSLAIIPLISMISAMLITIVVLGGDPHIPLILGTIVAAFIAWRFGYTWSESKQVFIKEFV